MNGLNACTCNGLSWRLSGIALAIFFVRVGYCLIVIFKNLRKCRYLQKGSVVVKVFCVERWRVVAKVKSVAKRPIRLTMS